MVAIYSNAFGFMFSAGTSGADADFLGSITLTIEAETTTDPFNFYSASSTDIYNILRVGPGPSSGSTAQNRFTEVITLTHNGLPLPGEWTFRIGIATWGAAANQSLILVGQETGTAREFVVPLANGPQPMPLIDSSAEVQSFLTSITNMSHVSGSGTLDGLVGEVVEGQLPTEITLVSVSSEGVRGFGSSYVEGSSISGDGRYITFFSSTGDLVAGDTNFVYDIFVHDTITGSTKRVNVASDGTQANSDHGDYASGISDDGRYVVFSSWADNLVAGDTNFGSDIFVHDTITGSTKRVNVASDGTEANSESHDHGSSISGDGRYVAFTSAADNLVAGDTNDALDVFVHDTVTGSTKRVNVATDGTQANSYSGHEGSTISDDGRYVAFASAADNLVAGDTNDVVDVFVHDTATGSTKRVNVASNGTEANAHSGDYGLSISGNGRFVAFSSWANNLVAGDTNGFYDIFVHDTVTGSTKRVNVASDGTQANSESGEYGASISNDGRYVAFTSLADNLVAGDINGFYDIFVHDSVTGSTKRVNVSNIGTQANSESGHLGSRISGDGQYITFSSDASNLVANDINNASDVFIVKNPFLDTTPSTPALTLTSANLLLEEGRSGSLIVQLDSASTQNVTFNFAFINGLATYGTDLAAQSKIGQVTIAAGQLSASIDIHALFDGLTESTENLQFRLISATNANLGSITETTINIVDRHLETSSALFQDHGKLVMLSTLSEAAYVLGDNEGRIDQADATRAAAFEMVKSWLLPLSASDLPTLRRITASNFNSVPSIDSDGRYNNGNAEALVARSSNALFVAFRGTDDIYDAVDWADRAGHFGKFAELLSSIVDYVQKSQLSDTPITEIYLTGHSLGAAMVAPAMQSLMASIAELGINMSYEGVTFATPGYGQIESYPFPKEAISNFWNGIDIINLPAFFSDVEGVKYSLNNAARDLLKSGVGPLTAHDVELYRGAFSFMFNEGKSHGINLDLLGLEVGLRGHMIGRIGYVFEKTSENSYTYGQADDTMVAGLFEISQDAIGTVADEAISILAPSVFELIDATKDLQQVVTTFDGLLDAPGAGTAAKLGESLFKVLENIPFVKKALALPLTLLATGTALINAIEAYVASDVLLGGNGNDHLYGLGGNDVLLGGRGNDMLLGMEGDDYLLGGDDSDYLFAGSGNNSLFGGKEDDFYFVSSATDYAQEKANEGIDTVFSESSYHLNALANLNVERLVLLGVGWHDGTGNALANKITGNSYGNVLKGLAGNDIIDGSGGSDTIEGGDNDDGLIGGSGNDTLRGGAGIDRMAGGADNDTYEVDHVSDIVHEAAKGGYDTVLTKYSFTLSTLAEVEVLKMQVARGTITTALKGNDYGQSITGNEGKNHIFGYKGVDKLQGLGGNDYLYGGADGDYLTGGKGADVLFGDTGSDQFIYKTVAESTVSLVGRDTIVDFNKVGDRINVSAIDANSNTWFNNAFSFVGTGAITGLGQIRAYQNGANTLVLFNTTGSTASDMVIELKNFTASNLNAGDFIL